MPRRAWQVSTERIFTLSRPAFSIVLTLRLVDLLVGAHQHLAGDRVVDVVQGHAAEDALAQRLDDLAALDQGADEQAVHACRSRTR